MITLTHLLTYRYLPPPVEALWFAGIMIGVMILIIVIGAWRNEENKTVSSSRHFGDNLDDPTRDVEDGSGLGQ